jgi:hypothetical protein
MGFKFPVSRTEPAVGNHHAATIGRRGLIAGSAGIALLLTLQRAASAQEPSTGQRVFLYGLPQPQAGNSSSVRGVSRTAQGTFRSALVSAPVSGEHAALPVRSPDGSVLALTSLTGSPRPALAVSLLDTGSSSALFTGTLPLTAVPDGAQVLVTPVFSADSAVLALVLSVTVPGNWRTVVKTNPQTGLSQSYQAATWVSHHELAYLDRSSGSFSGPFKLDDEPSLARVSVAATATDLFLWTVDEAAALIKAKGFKSGGSVRPTTRLQAFPLGAGKARFTVPAPGPWPVSGEPVQVLPSGDLVRLSYGRVAEIYSAQTGDSSVFPIPALDLPSAKPGVPTMQALADGTVFINSPAIGRAVIADPARSFQPRAVVRYAPPRRMASAPDSKAVLSADGKTLYVLGGAQVGGLAAYDVATSQLVGSYSSGAHYNGLYQLSDGTLLAIPQGIAPLETYSPSLTLLGTSGVDISVAAVL